MLRPPPRRAAARPALTVPVSGRRCRSRRGEAELALGLAVLAANTLAAAPAAAADWGGQAALTSDAIYRGVSESSGQPAAQAEVHASTTGGTFAGVSALGSFSTAPERLREPGAAAELGVYVGQRLALSESWNAQLSAYGHFFLDRERSIPSNYQEISAQVSYLDLWSISLTALPDAPRPGMPASYAYGSMSAYPGTQPGHYQAWVAATQFQWGLSAHFFITGGAGYYFVQGHLCYYGYTCSGTSPESALGSSPPRGYAYGAAGAAYQWQHWRLDVGYFVTGSAAAQLYAFPTPKERVAGTLSWSF